MNRKNALYVFIIVMGVVNIVLQGWLLLLNSPAAQPMWIVFGLFFIFAGFIRIQRQRLDASE